MWARTWTEQGHGQKHRPWCGLLSVPVPLGARDMDRKTKKPSGEVNKYCFGLRTRGFYELEGQMAATTGLWWHWCETSNRPVGSMRQGAGLLGSTQEGRNTAVLSSIPTQRWAKGAKTGKQWDTASHHGLATCLLSARARHLLWANAGLSDEAGVGQLEQNSCCKAAGTLRMAYKRFFFSFLLPAALTFFTTVT